MLGMRAVLLDDLDVVLLMLMLVLNVDVDVHVDSEVGEYIKIFIQSWSSILLPLLMVNGSVAGC